MTRQTRRTHAPGFKAKEALAAITKGEQTLAELAQQCMAVGQIRGSLSARL